METTNFTSPLEAVQMISMFSYLNTMSDYLFIKNYLNESNQHQPVPIVNALYNYLFLNKIFTIRYNATEREIMKTRKINLARKLINGTDLYGAKKNETLDEIFVDTLYKHIITTIVFEKYTSIYGFLAEIVRNSENLQINKLYLKIKSTLSKEIYLNENGSESKLEEPVLWKILVDFILPLLPDPDSEMSLLSVDYIYAQAGSIFLNSATTPSLLAPVDYKDLDRDYNNHQFNDYITAAFSIEQSVFAGKMNESALSIFSLPALLHYVYKQKQELQSQSIASIIKNSTLEIEMYKMLFTFLNETFNAIEKAKENDYKYQFYLAMSNFKNRTTLARQTIESKCEFVRGEKLEQEILKYKNNHDNYQCNTGNKMGTLVDINRVFQNHVDNITKKYFTYEKESIKEIFGENLLESFETNKIEIYRGLIMFIVGEGQGTFAAGEHQFVRKSDDLFKFFFTDYQKSVYYAILREDNSMTIIQENDALTSGCSTSSTDSIFSTGSTTGTPTSTVIQCSPKTFREKIGLKSNQMEFKDEYFYTLKKQENESFDIFLTRVTEERASIFNKSLSREGYDQTRKEWWTDFGLSLIPFYNCVHGFKTNDFEEALVSCSLDALMTFFFIGEIGSFVGKLTTAVTKSVLSLAGTTMRSLVIRLTIREGLSNLGTALIREGAKYSVLFTKETFKRLGVTLFRFFDPGFELVYSIGKGGLKLMITSIKALKKISTTFLSLEETLLKVKNKLSNSLFKKVDTLFEKGVYVNSLSSKSSGYGYKFIQIEDQVALIRKVKEYGKEIPVVLYRESETNKIICRAMNIKTGQIENDILHLRDLHPLRSELKPVVFRFESFHNSHLCKISRGKRSPDEFQCLRNMLRMGREVLEKEAVMFGVKHGIKKDDVHKQLRRFIFPSDSSVHNRLEFVKDWSKLLKRGEKELPAWSKQYEIRNPEVFEQLLYADRMDVPLITEDVAIFSNIVSEAFYTLDELKDLIIKFKSLKTYESLIFEDFLSIKNFFTTGFERIASSTSEAISMRKALYRLTVRQSPLPFEDFAPTLYRVEARPREAVDSFFFTANKEPAVGKEILLNGFTTTSSRLNVAKTSVSAEQLASNPNFERVIYEMGFGERYFRAKVGSIEVLPPESKFYIQDVKRITDESGETFVNVQLAFNYKELPRHVFYKKIMDELDRLERYTSTPFYKKKSLDEFQ